MTIREVYDGSGRAIYEPDRAGLRRDFVVLMTDWIYSSQPRSAGGPRPHSGIRSRGWLYSRMIRMGSPGT